MKLISILVLCIFISCQCFSQSLEGEWEGTYDIDFGLPDMFATPTKLVFVLDKDSSYKVYSYSKGKDINNRDTIIVCKVLYNRVSEDSLYLEETEVLKPAYAKQDCLQKMKLRVKRRNRSIQLTGTWQSAECNTHGQIRLTKKG